MIRALLDSGASDSFVSWDVVRALGLRQYPLSQRLTVRVANGEALAVTHFVQLSARLGPMPVRVSLRVIKTTIPIVLGYPFFARTQPTIDRKQLVLRIERKGKVFEINVLAIADSYRMTCPVVRVAKMEEGEVEVGKELKEDDGVGVVANLQAELAKIEEVMPTLEDQQQVSRRVDAKWKTRQRLRNSPMKEVDKLIRDVDHTICGPPCE